MSTNKPSPLSTRPLSRRSLFSILPAGVAGCLGCGAARLCGAQAQAAPPEHSAAEKSDLTWEQVFRFTYQRNFIPTLKAVQAQIGNEPFIAMLQEGVTKAAIAGMAKNPQRNRDFATWVKGLRDVPPLYQHALAYSVVEDSPQAFEIRVTQCLWAKIFREENAADIGYAGICHPDFAAASGFNPKLKLIRSRTLMQGHGYCNHRYVMEA